VTTGKDYLAGTIILRREALPGERHSKQSYSTENSQANRQRERDKNLSILLTTSARAEITFPSVVRDLLMFAPS